MNPAEEPAFLWSLYHFFVWKAGHENYHKQQVAAAAAAGFSKNHPKPSVTTVTAPSTGKTGTAVNNGSGEKQVTVAMAVSAGNKESSTKKVAVAPVAVCTKNTEPSSSVVAPPSKNTAESAGNTGSSKNQSAMAVAVSAKNTKPSSTADGATTNIAGSGGNNESNKKMPVQEKRADANVSLSRPGPPPAVANPMMLPCARYPYSRLLQVMREEFPEIAQRFPHDSQHVPPDIAMRYSVFPSISSEVTSLRARNNFLEHAFRSQPPKAVPSSLKRKDAPLPTLATAAVSAGSGAARTSKRARTSTGTMIVARRKDVPEDVKKFVSEVRQKATYEKNNARRKIARLEAAVAKAKEKLKTSKPAEPMQPPAETVPPPKPRKEPVKLKSFDEMFNELVHFQKGNGHCRVPIRIPGLGRWVMELRANYRKTLDNPSLLDKIAPDGPCRLNHERMTRLNELGFQWDMGKETTPWETRFKQLEEYKEQFGNTLVPRSYKPLPSLGEWVHMQRKKYRKKCHTIMGEKVDKLNAIGFVWDTDRVLPTFEERLEECREFRRENGHLNVPRVPKEKDRLDQLSKKERRFRSWAQRQRDNYVYLNKGRQVQGLDKRRIKQLDELGFDWTRDPWLGRGKYVRKKYKKGEPRRLEDGDENEHVQDDNAASTSEQGDSM